MENEHFNQFGQKWHHLVTILVNIVKLMHLHDTCHNKVKDLEFLINKELAGTIEVLLLLSLQLGMSCSWY